MAPLLPRRTWAHTNSNLQRRTPRLGQEPLALSHESGIQRRQRRRAVLGRREPSAEVAPGREVRPRPQRLVARRLDLGAQRVQLDARLRRPRELLPECVPLGFEPGDAFLEGVDALRVRRAPAQFAPQRVRGLAGRVRDALGRASSQRLDFGSRLLEGPPQVRVISPRAGQCQRRRLEVCVSRFAQLPQGSISLVTQSSDSGCLGCVGETGEVSRRWRVSGK